MDVGVLGQSRFTPDIPNSVVAAAAGSTLERACCAGLTENQAMTRMAAAAVLLAKEPVSTRGGTGGDRSWRHHGNRSRT